MTDLANHPVADLLRPHGEVLDEFRRRAVMWNTIGDYGELLFSRAYGWDLRTNSASGFDAVDDQAVRYQIKCRRLDAPGAVRVARGGC